MAPFRVVHIYQMTWCHISFSHYKENFKSHINKIFCYGWSVTRNEKNYSYERV